MPISVISIISRVFERIIPEDILSFLINNDLIYSSQYGFRSVKSWTKAIDKHFKDIIYLEVSQFFKLKHAIQLND